MKTQSTYLFRFTKLTLFCLAIVLLTNQSQARDAFFSWTANPEPLTGYKLYYKTGEDSTPPYNGTGLTQGDSPILIGKVNEYTVTGLLDTKTYHFVLTAYYGEDESDYTKVESSDAITILPPTITTMSQN